ncbi:MAG: hypothetical protein ACKO38_13260, partial [Planctomycetota bacterium]
DYDQQEILKVDSATVTIPKINVSGSVNPYTRKNGTRIPGLVVRGNGFHLGDAQLSYTAPISLGSFLELRDIRAGVTGFGITFGAGVDFNGQIYIASGGATLLPGKPISMEISDGPDADTEAVRAGLSFSNGVPSGFKFKADKLKMNLSSFITVTGEGIEINSEAGPNEYVAKFDSLGAEVKAGPLKIGGKIRRFAFTGDGSFVTLTGFGVFLSVDEASPGAMKWPSWLPIRLTKLGIQWRDIQNDPADFSLIVSASVTKIPGIPLEFKGSVEGLRIDVGLLAQGKFPVTDLDSISVKVGGSFGAAEISGALIGGIMKLDANGNQVDSFDLDTPVTDRVLFIGLEGKLLIAQKGFQIRFAFSELGPLGVMISVKAPLVVEPVFTGITIDELTGGIEFFKSLPSVSEPEDLRGKEFADTTKLDSDTWLKQVKEQVINQVRAVKANPNIPGFLAAFISPMMLTAQAAISSTHTGSADTFNGQVRLSLSTDGKMFASGKFRFMNNRLVISGKLYADLSQILKGNAKVLFLGEAPVIEDMPDLKFLVLKGKFEMRFILPGGEIVKLDDTLMNSDSSKPSANLASPASGATVGLKDLATKRTIDVSFTKGAKSLKLDTISDMEAEISLTLPNGTVVDLTGVATKVTTASDPNTYRYTIPTSTVLTPGEYVVTIMEGTFTDTADLGNASEIEKFTVAAPQAELASPRADGEVDVQVINDATIGKAIEVRFRGVNGALPKASTIEDAAAEFTLHGFAAQAVSIGATPVKVDDTTFRYPVTGQFGIGDVEVRFIAKSFTDADDNESVASTATFTVAGPTVTLMGFATPIQKLNELGYIDVWFEASRNGTLDANSILDAGPEFSFSGTPAAGVTLTTVESLGDGHSFRYYFTGNFASGTVSVNYLAGSFIDSNGIANGPTTDLLRVIGFRGVFD